MPSPTSSSSPLTYAQLEAAYKDLIDSGGYPPPVIVTTGRTINRLVGREVLKPDALYRVSGLDNRVTEVEVEDA